MQCVVGPCIQKIEGELGMTWENKGVSYSVENSTFLGKQVRGEGLSTCKHRQGLPAWLPVEESTTSGWGHALQICAETLIQLALHVFIQ